MGSKTSIYTLGKVPDLTNYIDIIVPHKVQTKRLEGYSKSCRIVDNFGNTVADIERTDRYVKFYKRTKDLGTYYVYPFSKTYLGRSNNQVEMLDLSYTTTITGKSSKLIFPANINIQTMNFDYNCRCYMPSPGIDPDLDNLQGRMEVEKYDLFPGPTQTGVKWGYNLSNTSNQWQITSMQNVSIPHCIMAMITKSNPSDTSYFDLKLTMESSNSVRVEFRLRIYLHGTDRFSLQFGPPQGSPLVTKWKVVNCWVALFARDGNSYTNFYGTNQDLSD